MPVTIEQLKRRLEMSKHEDQQLKTFSEGLFAKADAEFLAAFDVEILLPMALSGLKFLRNAQAEVNVRVYNPSYQADGWETPYTVLELSMRDRPFIVDSVRAALKQQSHELYYLLHPIFKVERDEAGRLLSLQQNQGQYEAYELYFLEREDDPEVLKALEERIRQVLGDVLLATHDYHPMRQKVRQVSQYLQHLRERSAQGYFRQRAEEIEEYASFLEWLEEDNFVFLGYREYEILQLNEVPHLQIRPDSGLGILSKTQNSAYREPVPLQQISDNLRERIIGGRTLIVTKTNAESTVHRPARMDYIGVKRYGESWEVQGEHRFIGLFTSKALSTPVQDTPILKLKLRQVLTLDHAVPGSHDYKQITSIFNSMPREELFWSNAERLHQDIRTIMGLEQERGVRLTIRPDPLGRGLAAMVVMPRDRFNAEVRRNIQNFLYKKLAATHVDYQLAMGEDESQLRFHFFFMTELSYSEVDVPALEKEVLELSRTWDDHLLERLAALRGEVQGRRLAERYMSAFDPAYKADVSHLTAIRDIEQLESLGESGYRVDILNAFEPRYTRDGSQIKIYHHERTLILSSIMPILENMGFRVLEQISYVAELSGGGKGVDIFRVSDHAGQLIDVRQHAERLTEALLALLNDEAENDRLNHLVFYAGLNIRQVALLRSYRMYYAQLNAVTSLRFITDTLLKHPALASLLYSMFAARFNPAFDGDRSDAHEALKSDFLDALNQVSSLPEDTVLRGLCNLIEATMRTNYYLRREVISFKLDSQKVASMPEPRPRFEIAVSGLGVDGSHLRGGKVARGGIRWSDRPDDFRTEVLGLMKTQMTKNAVIVPVGSKGGFVLKRAPAEREALRAYVEQQYRAFIRGLLDITDNVVAGKVVHPAEIIVYDDDDPYLVVAADKGTATFSDLANEMAAEYQFWLGDAFASGGSYGYDHKKEGITARGTWECVDRHFRELGINIFADTFSVAGIGDMAGDVFGNGMLYSDTIRLQAAFNHQHIFLDPNPDPKKSFAERQRLFRLPRSSWRDYQPELFSKGGGVFDRAAKSISLSPEVRDMLEVSATSLSGPELIKAILRMPVDLLWNGGIGTYIKASSESHAEVGDSSNDGVRINASDLRAKVIGEGGNLGLTQLARIEYALAGGAINTDAIDNSAGVDMSDHEVNIKMMLEPLLKSGDLSFQQRNRLLIEMTEEVNQLVLKDNYFQSLALSLALRRSRRNIRLFAAVQEELSDRGVLRPELEFLPNQRQLEERFRSGEGYSRPELAILLAYTKMELYQALLDSDLPDEATFDRYLQDYFPKVLSTHYEASVASHPLRREIVATQFTNTVVDLLGLSFVHRLRRDTGSGDVAIIRAALMALELLDARHFLDKLTALDRQLAMDVQYRGLEQLVKSVEGIAVWILLTDKTTPDLSAFIAAYQAALRKVSSELPNLLISSEKRRYQTEHKRWQKLGLASALASEVAALTYLPSSMGLIEVSESLSVELAECARVFYELGERLSLGWLRDQISALDTQSNWDTIAQSTLIMDVRRAQQRLTEAYLLKNQQQATSISDFLGQQSQLGRYDAACSQVQEGDLSMSAALVLTRLLSQML